MPRFLFASSCSLYGVAGDAMLTEEAAFNPITPYGESKVLVERDVAPLADDALQPDVPAQRDGLRRLAAPARRRRREQPRRLRATRRARSSSRATARRGGRSCTSRTSPARSSPCSRRRASWCTTRRSTSAAPRRTTRSATSRRWCARSSRAAASATPRAAARIRAATGWTATSSPRDAARLPAAVDGPARDVEELLRGASAATGLTDRATFAGDRYLRIKQIQRAAGSEGRLDDDRCAWAVGASGRRGRSRS